MSEEAIALQAQESAITDEGLREMVEAGVFYGRNKSKTNPKMRSYILGARNEIEIIDLNRTQEDLAKALEFLKKRTASGGKVLFVGTQPAAAEEVQKVAGHFGFPQVSGRWIGGTITNFKVISKRIEHLKQLMRDWAANAFSQYTKKERLGFERELRNLTEVMGGLLELTAKPEAAIIIDPQVHAIAVREANRAGIPIVALLNTDADPDSVQYPVAGNTKSRSSIGWFLEKIRAAMQEGIEQEKAVRAKEAEQGEKQ